MAAVLYWRLPELLTAGRGPVPWLPGIPEKLDEHPAWGEYLTKRSGLVVDLAQQIRDHPCRDDAQPVWAPPGSHPSTALVGEVTIWRAANGIDQRDPRPTGGVQLETAPTLWQQRLDRAVARLMTCRGIRSSKGDGQLAPNVIATTTTANARTKHPDAVQGGRLRPAASTTAVVKFGK
jgi:hypothetical protein